MAGHKFEIKINALGQGTVKMDGQNLTGVIAVKLESEAMSPPRVSVTFWASDVDVEAEAELEAPA